MSYMTPPGDRPRAGQAHRRPEGSQAGGGDRAAQSVASRSQIDETLRQEVTPKNILMIGPTGVGKTEIARRLARLANAPFIKVEATKFTEVGYVGRDVRVDHQGPRPTSRSRRTASRRWTRCEAMRKRRRRSACSMCCFVPREAVARLSGGDEGMASTRQKFRKMLREGKLDEREVEIEVSGPSVGVEIVSPARNGGSHLAVAGHVSEHVGRKHPYPEDAGQVGAVAPRRRGSRQNDRRGGR